MASVFISLCIFFHHSVPVWNCIPFRFCFESLFLFLLYSQLLFEFISNLSLSLSLRMAAHNLTVPTLDRKERKTETTSRIDPRGRKREKANLTLAYSFCRVFFDNPHLFLSIFFFFVLCFT